MTHNVAVRFLRAEGEKIFKNKFISKWLFDVKYFLGFRH